MNLIKDIFKLIKNLKIKIILVWKIIKKRIIKWEWNFFFKMQNWIINLMKWLNDIEFKWLFYFILKINKFTEDKIIKNEKIKNIKIFTSV